MFPEMLLLSDKMSDMSFLYCNIFWNAVVFLFFLRLFSEMLYFDIKGPP